MKSLTVGSRIAPCLRVAAATLIVLMAQAALAAAPIKFRPGAADACEVNVNRIPGASPADLDQYRRRHGVRVGGPAPDVRVSRRVAGR